MRTVIFPLIVASALFLTAPAFGGDVSDTSVNDKDDEYSSRSSMSSSEELSDEALTGDQPRTADDASDERSNRPNLICAEGGLCKCIIGNTSRIDCSHVQLKNKRPLNTAHLEVVVQLKNFTAQEVDLSHNEIQLLRRDHIVLEQNKNVLALDVSYNRIAGIQQSALDTFEKLVKLKLTHNRLLDDEVNQFWLTEQLGQTLHQLYLDYNYLRRLDDGVFDQLSNLNKLVLDGNVGLTLNANTFGRGGLTKLRTLSLDNCGISSLDENVFANLPHLEQLSLAGNPIAQVLPALRRLPVLQVLSLSETQLTEVPKLAFRANTALQSVYLRKMKHLRRVNSCAFCRLDNLKLVDVSNSPYLSDFHVNAFGGTSDKELLPYHLEHFYVEGCNLTRLSAQLIRWTAVRSFGAAHNPWHCDCRMYWLVANTKLHRFTGHDEPTCKSPPRLNGVELRKAAVRLACTDDDMRKGAMTTKDVDDDDDASSHGTTGSGMLFIGFLCIVTVFVVGVAVAQRFGATTAAQEFLSRRRGSPTLSTTPYRNISADVPSDDAFPDAAAAATTDTPPLEDDFNRSEFV